MRAFLLSAVLIPSVFFTQQIPAATVTGWSPETGFGNNGTLQINNAATASPSAVNVSSVPGNTIRNTSLWAAFPSVSLNDGDQVVLSGSVSFISTNPPSTTIGSGLAQQFRWGLFKDADGDPDFTDWLGYAPNDGSGSTLGAFNRRPAPGGTSIFASMGTLAGGTRTSVGGLAAGVTYNFNLDILRVGSSYNFTAFLQSSDLTYNTTFLGVTDASPVTFSFDHAAFLIGNNFSSLAEADFQNIDVTYLVPEPSSGLLAAVSGLICLLFRSRKRLAVPTS
jgi:hypothetical protein